MLGIAVGMAGLVALGAMAERISRFIEGGDRFVLGQISVAGEGMGMGAGFTAGGLLPAARIAEIARVPGVAVVQPQVMLPISTSTSHFLTLTQELVMGVDPAAPLANRHYRALPVRSGRALAAGDRKVAVLGSDFAASRKLAVGAALPIGALEFTVVGILDKTLTAPDRFAMVPLEDARDVWLRRDPLLFRVFGSGGLTRADLNSGAAVGWQDGVDPDELARRIQAAVKGVNVTIPGELSRLLRTSTAFFSALLIGIGTLALVIGGLSLANTVTAAVFERIRDFGVKRALGATDGQLLREVLGEALGVSLWGVGTRRAASPSPSAPRWTRGRFARASSSSSSRRACSASPSSSRCCWAVSPPPTPPSASPGSRPPRPSAAGREPCSSARIGLGKALSGSGRRAARARARRRGPRGQAGAGARRDRRVRLGQVHPAQPPGPARAGRRRRDLVRRASA